MTERDHNKAVAKGSSKSDRKEERDPQWTSSLKNLYESVVHEPLPDTLKDLLAKLDDDRKK